MYTVVKSSFPGFDALRAHGLAAMLHHLSSIGGQPEPIRIVDRGVSYVVDPDDLSDAGVRAAFSAPRLRWIREWNGRFSHESLKAVGATTAHPLKDEASGDLVHLRDYIYPRLHDRTLIEQVFDRYRSEGAPLKVGGSPGKTVPGTLDVAVAKSVRGSAYAHTEKKKNVTVSEPDWIVGLVGRLIASAISSAPTKEGRRYTFITGIPFDYAYYSRSMSGLGAAWQIGQLPPALQGAYYLIGSLYGWAGGVVPFSGYSIESWLVPTKGGSRVEFGRTLRCYTPLTNYPDDMLRLQDQIDRASRQNDAGDAVANAVAEFLWNPSTQSLRGLAFTSLRARAAHGRRPLALSERFAKEAVRLQPVEGKRFQDLYESAAVLECGRLLRNVFSNRVRSDSGESPDYEFLADLESIGTPGDLASALERALHRAVIAKGSHAWVPSEQRIAEVMRCADVYGAQQVATAIALFGLTFAKQTKGESESESEAATNVEERGEIAE